MAGLRMHMIRLRHVAGSTEVAGLYADARLAQEDVTRLQRLVADGALPGVWLAEVVQVAVHTTLQYETRVSVDNGATYHTAESLPEADLARHWDALAATMDTYPRERVHAELAPCSPREFLAAYLALATCDLVIG